EKEIDALDLQSPEHCLHNLPDVLGPAVEAIHSSVRVDSESELAGDRHTAAERSQCFAQEFFVGEGTIDFGGVEEGHAAFGGGPDQCDHLAAIGSGAVETAHPHAAEADGGYFEIAVSKPSFFHFYSICTNWHLFAGSRFRLRKTGRNQFECLAQERHDRAGRAVTQPAVHNSSDDRSHHGRRYLRIQIFPALYTAALGDDLSQLNLCYHGCLENLAMNGRFGEDEPNPLQPPFGVSQRFTFLFWRLKLHSHGIGERRPQRLAGGTSAQ